MQDFPNKFAPTIYKEFFFIKKEKEKKVSYCRSQLFFTNQRYFHCCTKKCQYYNKYLYLYAVKILYL